MRIYTLSGTNISDLEPVARKCTQYTPHLALYANAHETHTGMAYRWPQTTIKVQLFLPRPNFYGEFLFFETLAVYCMPASFMPYC